MNAGSRLLHTSVHFKKEREAGKVFLTQSKHYSAFTSDTHPFYMKISTYCFPYFVTNICLIIVKKTIKLKIIPKPKTSSRVKFVKAGKPPVFKQNQSQCRQMIKVKQLIRGHKQIQADRSRWRWEMLGNTELAEVCSGTGL